MSTIVTKSAVSAQPPSVSQSVRGERGAPLSTAEPPVTQSVRSERGAPPAKKVPSVTVEQAKADVEYSRLTTPSGAPFPGITRSRSSQLLACLDASYVDWMNAKLSKKGLHIESIEKLDPITAISFLELASGQVVGTKYHLETKNVFMLLENAKIAIDFARRLGVKLHSFRPEHFNEDNTKMMLAFAFACVQRFSLRNLDGKSDDEAGAKSFLVKWASALVGGAVPITDIYASFSDGLAFLALLRAVGEVVDLDAYRGQPPEVVFAKARDLWAGAGHHLLIDPDFAGALDERSILLALSELHAFLEERSQNKAKVHLKVAWKTRVGQEVRVVGLGPEITLHWLDAEHWAGDIELVRGRHLYQYFVVENGETIDCEREEDHVLDFDSDEVYIDDAFHTKAWLIGYIDEIPKVGLRPFAARDAPKISNGRTQIRCYCPTVRADQVLSVVLEGGRKIVGDPAHFPNFTFLVEGVRPWFRYKFVVDEADGTLVAETGAYDGIVAGKPASAIVDNWIIKPFGY